MKPSKDRLEYWKNVMKKQNAPRDTWETSAKNKNWEVFIQFRGRREWFNLNTTNKEAASVKAREIYRALHGGGWVVALEKFKPTMIQRISQPTLGEFLNAVSAHSSIKPVTLAVYANKLRGMVGEISADAAGRKRYVPSKRWREKIESTRLDKLTIAAIQKWKRDRLANAANPLELVRRERTVNSILRNAKSLFTDKLLKQLPFSFEVAPALREVDFVKTSKPRYTSSIDLPALMEAACNELKAQDVEAYKIFQLALQAGLRRREIDGLQWSQIDFSRNVIRIQTTEYTSLKSSESEQPVDISPDFAEELREFFKRSSSNFVIDIPMARTQYRFGEYRCDAVFLRLIDWLRAHGVKDQKPIHTLRKEFGSVIAHQHGIFLASHALRHSDISVTRDSYLDKRAATFFSLKPAVGLHSEELKVS